MYSAFDSIEWRGLRITLQNNFWRRPPKDGMPELVVWADGRLWKAKVGPRFASSDSASSLALGDSPQDALDNAMLYWASEFMRLPDFSAFLRIAAVKCVMDA